MQKGELRALIQGPKSYEEMQRAIGILKLLSQGEFDIRSGKTDEQAAVFKKIEGPLRPRE